MLRNKDKGRDAEKTKKDGGMLAVEVAGEFPHVMPEVGDIVLLPWGDPQLVGGPTFDAPLLVTLIDPQTGRINGHMVCDLTMQGIDSRSGRPMAMPATVPMGNLPFSLTRRPLTWRPKTPWEQRPRIEHAAPADAGVVGTDDGVG